MSWGARERVGLDIAPDAVTLVRVRGRGRRAVVTDCRVQALPPGVLGVSPIEPNIADPAEFTRALKAVCRHRRIGPVAVSLPDPLARVALFDLATVPAKPADLDRLVRWQVEKLFSVELPTSTIVHQTFRRTDGQPGYRVLASAIERTLLAQYEDLLLEAGLELRVIDLASFHRFNAHRASMARLARPDQQFIVLTITSAGLTAMIFENGNPAYLRIKGTRRPLVGPESVDRVLDEVEVSLNAYGKEKDLSKFTHLFVSAVGAAEDLSTRLEERFHLTVRRLGTADLPFVRTGVLSNQDVERAAAALGAAGR